MYEEHISDEDIKRFVSYQGTLKGEEGKAFIELSKNVNGHIRGCKDCLEKVTKAQKEQDKIDGMEDEYITDRSKHMKTVDEISDQIAEGFGINKETARAQREMHEEIIGKMHDKGQPYIGHEDLDILEEIAKKSRSGIDVEPRATEERPIAKVDAKKIIEAQEAYDLTPAETKKGGFIDYVKGIIDKIKGMFGR